MKVKFEFTIDDVVNVSERTLGRSKVVRAWRWEGLVTTSIVGGVIGYLGVSGTDEQRIWSAVMAGLFCAAIYPTISGRDRTRRLRKAFREQFGGDGPFTCEVELLPEGVASTQRGTRSLRAWSAITSVEDTHDSVDFYTRGAGTLVVRNRAFKSPEERTQFLELARGYAGAPKKA